MYLRLHMARLKTMLEQFRDDVRGTIMVETVITLPILIVMMVATFEFFEVHRYKSAREKATYTVADMLSREQATINQTYVDNIKVLFDQITNDDGINQVRVSHIQFDEDDDAYETIWSEVRGVGELSAFPTGTFANGHQTLPNMSDGETLFLVESVSAYEPLLDLVFDENIEIETRTFTSLRFSTHVCLDDKCTSD